MFSPRSSRAKLIATNACKGAADIKTELALLNDRLSKNQKRIDLTQQVANLAKLGVPKLNGPIIPVTRAA